MKNLHTMPHLFHQDLSNGRFFIRMHTSVDDCNQSLPNRINEWIDMDIKGELLNKILFQGFYHILFGL